MAVSAPAGGVPAESVGGGQQRLHGVGEAGGQRHLDEDQRLVGQRLVEEGEAAAVRQQATA